MRLCGFLFLPSGTLFGAGIAFLLLFVVKRADWHRHGLVLLSQFGVQTPLSAMNGRYLGRCCVVELFGSVQRGPKPDFSSGTLSMAASAEQAKKRTIRNQTNIRARLSVPLQRVGLMVQERASAPIRSRPVRSGLRLSRAEPSAPGKWRATPLCVPS